MQEIEALYFAEGKDEPKICWFPFKKVYTRSQIKAGEDNAGTLVLSLPSLQVPLQVPPQDFDVSQLDPPSGMGAVALKGQKGRNSRLSEAETNSIVSEGDTFYTEYKKTASQIIAAINPNPMCKEFWVDEIVEGGSLNCAFPTFEGRTLDPQGNHAMFLHKRAGAGQPLQEISFVRESTPTGSGTYGELDLSQSRRNRSSTSLENGPTTAISRGSVMAKEGAMPVCCSMKSSWPVGGGSTASTDVSTTSGWIDSEIDAASTTDSLSRRMRSFGSKDRVAYNNSNKCGVPVYEDAESLRMEGNHRGILCGAIPRKQSRIDLKTTHSFPSIGTSSLEKVLGEDIVPNANPDNRLLNSVRPSSKCIGDQVNQKQEDTAPIGCISTAAIGDLLIAGSEFLPAFYRAPVKKLPYQDDPAQPHFFVEVEATKKQLQEVKDLGHIKAKAGGVLPSVKVARKSSLVDEDSAFMDTESIGYVHQRFPPKRSSPKGKPSIDRQRHSKNHVAAVVTPAPANERPFKTPSDGISSGRVAPVTPHQKSSRLASEANQSNPPTRTHRTEPPIPRTILGPYLPKEDAIMDWRGRDEIGSKLDNTSSRQGRSSTHRASLSKVVEKIPKNSAVLDSKETVATQKEQGRASDRTDPPTMTVIHLKSRPLKDRSNTREMTIDTNQRLVGELAHDFELARFPSLSSADWQRNHYVPSGGQFR